MRGWSRERGHRGWRRCGRERGRGSGGGKEKGTEEGERVGAGGLRGWGREVEEEEE